MFFRSFLTSFVALLGARLVGATATSQIHAREDSAFASVTPSTGLVWSACFTDVDPNFSCALLDVPLDYANPKERKAYVPFVRYAAVNSSGTVLINPGGPGISGVEAFLGTGPSYALFLGLNFDFVSFDPRGIGYSIPSATCNVSSSTAAPLTRRFMDKIRLYGPRFGVEYFTRYYETDRNLGKQCQSTIGGPNDAGPYMNTAVVARDIISFLDAYSKSDYSAGVSEPGLLNLWGFSYGTYIGQVFANMFPDRVGHVVLDGVVDAYAARSGRELTPTYADEAFSTFFVYCHLAGETDCPYYTGTTSRDILARFEATVTRLDPTLAKLKGWANATLIEQILEAIKYFSYQSTYDPILLPFYNASDTTIASFSNLALFLLDAEAAVQDITSAKYEALEAKYGLDLQSFPYEWANGVLCTDNNNIFYGRSLLSFLPRILALEAQSYIIGESISLSATECAGWSIKGKGIYKGHFGGETKNPILFVSNTRDIVCPIENGQKAAKLYKGAQLLTIEGTGHTSPALVNLCSLGVIGTFFQTGVVSSNHCALEAGPWGIVATESALKKRGMTEITSGLKAMIRAR